MKRLKLYDNKHLIELDYGVRYHFKHDIKNKKLNNLGNTLASQLSTNIRSALTQHLYRDYEASGYTTRG